MANYAVVRTDNLAGTDVRSMLVSIEYMGADGNTPTAIENGNVLKVGALIDGEREIRVGSAPAASDDLKDIVLVASPEIMYDPMSYSLDKFINEAGAPARGYHLHPADIFSVTAEALDAAADIEVGQIVELQAGTKLKVVASATSGSTTVGTITHIETVGKYTFYAILVG